MKPRLAVLGLVVALLVACGPGARDKALRHTLAGANVARAGYLVWDDQAEAAIIEQATSVEQGKAAQAEHRKRSDMLLAALEATYYALAIAATDLDDQNLAAATIAAAKLFALYRELTGDGPGSEASR